MRDSLVLLQSSLIIDKTIGEEIYDWAYAEAFREIKRNLIKHGRDSEKISWEQGDYMFGEEWPLDISKGPSDYYRITGWCRVPESHLSNEMRENYNA